MNKKITHLEETAENYSFREMAESFCKLLKTDRKMFFIYLRIFKMQYDKASWRKSAYRQGYMDAMKEMSRGEDNAST